MVNYEYPPLGGGGGVFNRHLAEALTGHLQVTVLTTRMDDLPVEEESGGVRIVRVPVLQRTEQPVASLASMLSFFPSSLRRGLRLLGEEQYDVVHSMFAVPSAVSGILLARRAGVPHVLSLLGGDVYDPTKRLSPHRTPGLFHTVRTMVRRSDRVVAMSNDIRERLKGLYGIDRQVDLVPHGISLQPAPPRPREDFGFRAGEMVLITVGRLIPRKGLDDLIRIVAGLEEPGLILALIGGGPLRHELEDLARAHGIQDRVRFFGYVDEDTKWQLLQAADIYVSTALHEGFGLVFLEAMGVSLPIVCYDEGGQVDFLADGESAYVVRLGDTGVFADRLRRLVRDPALRSRMGKAGMHAVEDYDIECCARRFLQIYEEAIRARTMS
jgi:glycosyltransferase involved in cell wall biosynthesis